MGREVVLSSEAGGGRPLPAVWHPRTALLTSAAGLKLRAVDLLSARLVQGDEPHLLLCFYVLEQGRRQRRLYRLHSDQLQLISDELRPRSRPRECPLAPGHLSSPFPPRGRPAGGAPGAGAPEPVQWAGQVAAALGAGLQSDIRRDRPALHRRAHRRVAGTRRDAALAEGAEHATRLAQQVCLGMYEALVLLSGDGTVNEVLSGLLTRADRLRALRLPLLHVPAGTSNALAAAVAFQSR